ncbi:MAG: hypothetical protein H6707_06370 [Deltaproteobacteria bacterium]|nr:hypothetical protein [Deltaproteobacteria bacterium]
MRVAGGIILLVVGLWSLGSGGCQILGGQVASGMSEGMGKLSSELTKAAKKAGAKVDEGKAAEAAAKLAEAGSMGSGLMIAGTVTLIGGLLCIIGGILTLTSKGKMFALIAPGIGILGEIIFFAMVTFSVIGLVKIILLAVGAMGASKIGQQA